MNAGTVDDEIMGHQQLWRGFSNMIAEVYPAFRDMETFKRGWDRFCQALQQEPRRTLFHLFVAVFGVLPFLGFILFITGAFLLTCVTGLVAFWFMFFSGLMVFATMGFLLLLCCAWLSWILAGAFTVWMEWPCLNRVVCTIKSKFFDKMVGLGFIAKEKSRLNAITINNRGDADATENCNHLDGGVDNEDKNCRYKGNVKHNSHNDDIRREANRNHQHWD